MTMSSTAWGGYDNRKAAALNVDRSRWYGLRPGDWVEMKGPGYYVVKGKVSHLHQTDNNGCTLRVKRGRVWVDVRGVCEWCTVTKKVER